MEQIVFDFSLFEDVDDIGIRRGRKSLLVLMEALTQINLLYLIDYPDTPDLYDTKVIYKPERGELWKDITRVVRDGWGDCEDLACWRIAELRNQGIAARPYIKWRPSPSNPSIDRYHAVLRLPDGRVEDPSRALGMHGHPMVRVPVYIEA